MAYYTNDHTVAIAGAAPRQALPTVGKPGLWWCAHALCRICSFAHHADTEQLVWYGMVWCPSYPLDRNRCDQVVAAGSGAG
jgi:hypothetical protein